MVGGYITEPNGRTDTFNVAFNNGDYDIIQLMVDNGFEWNYMSGNYSTCPLECVLIKKDVKLLSILLKSDQFFSNDTARLIVSLLKIEKDQDNIKLLETLLAFTNPEQDDRWIKYVLTERLNKLELYKQLIDGELTKDSQITQIQKLPQTIINIMGNVNLTDFSNHKDIEAKKTLCELIPLLPPSGSFPGGIEYQMAYDRFYA